MSETQELLQEVEDRAGEQLGIRRWDRPAIFRDAACAAVDADLPYWLVLVLSGAIATLGLALDSSAVVIGAMLIAPLLAPVVGLALALAVGDGRLAFQTALLVVVSTGAVIATGALLTLMLPFTTVTPEITARTRPTTLDLGIAVLSGLAGVVVTVARGHRLSAAIPGVAVAVALIPPLGVAGYGVGSGWNTELVWGSMLLYGANLAGIVLSGMLVFLLVGMHRPAVLEAARRWHREESATGLVAWVDRFAWVRRLGLIRSTAARVGLVVAFVVALAVPLSRTLAEISREVRVRGAVDETLSLFEQPGRSSVLSKEVVPTGEGTQVFLRVATTELYGEEAHDRFVRDASMRAGEPVRLVLEQLPATTGDVEQLAELLPAQDPRPVVPPPPPSPTRIPALVGQLRERLRQATEALPLPSGVVLAGVGFAFDGGDAATLRVGYISERPLPPEAEEILSRQLSDVVGDPAMRVQLVHLSSRPRPLAGGAAAELAALLARYPGARVELTGPEAAVAAAARGLSEAGVAPGRIGTRVEEGAEAVVARVLPLVAGG